MMDTLISFSLNLLVADGDRISNLVFQVTSNN